MRTVSMLALVGCAATAALTVSGCGPEQAFEPESPMFATVGHLDCWESFPQSQFGDFCVQLLRQIEKLTAIAGNSAAAATCREYGDLMFTGWLANGFRYETVENLIDAGLMTPDPINTVTTAEYYIGVSPWDHAVVYFTDAAFDQNGNLTLQPLQLLDLLGHEGKHLFSQSQSTDDPAVNKFGQPNLNSAFYWGATCAGLSQ